MPFGDSTFSYQLKKYFFFLKYTCIYYNCIVGLFSLAISAGLLLLFFGYQRNSTVEKLFSCVLYCNYFLVISMY